MSNLDPISQPVPNLQSVKFLETLVKQTTQETFTEQQKSILAAYRFQANLEIERLICWARIFFVAILVPAVLLTDGRLYALHWQPVLRLATCLVLVMYSWWMVGKLKTGHLSSFLLWVSVALEPLAAFLIMIPSIIEPMDIGTYHGFLRYPGFSILIFTIILSGSRGFRKLAWSGIVINLAAFLGLVFIDNHVWPAPVLEYGLKEVFSIGVLILCFGILGRVSAADTRRQAIQSSQIMLVAERVHDRFRSYVPVQVADEAVSLPELKLGGDRTQVAVLFSDIRGFTRYSENNDPESLVSELNEYLNAMMAAVNSEGGTVDKFLGDSLMAVFGLNRSSKSAPARAIRAALAMNQSLAGLNRVRASRGLPLFQHGIGVDYGQVVAGNIGGAERMEHTVIGEPVNMASRLQAATKKYGHSILVSEDAVEGAKKRPDIPLPRLTEVDSLQVRGSSRTIKIFTIAEGS